MTSILGALGSLWILFAMFCALAFGVMWPLMAWSVTRNVKGIRVQLERLNDSREGGAGGSRGGMLGI